MLTCWFEGRELASWPWLSEAVALIGGLEDRNSTSLRYVLGAAALGLGVVFVACWRR